MHSSLVTPANRYSHPLMIAARLLLLTTRLRAALFVNLVAMRRAMKHPSNGHVTMAAENLATLQRANWLFHAAHNSATAQRSAIFFEHLRM